MGLRIDKQLEMANHSPLFLGNRTPSVIKHLGHSLVVPDARWDGFGTYQPGYSSFPLIKVLDQLWWYVADRTVVFLCRSYWS